jgi:hypothetical protein
MEKPNSIDLKLDAQKFGELLQSRERGGSM